MTFGTELKDSFEKTGPKGFTFVDAWDGPLMATFVALHREAHILLISQRDTETGLDVQTVTMFGAEEAIRLSKTLDKYINEEIE